MDTQKQENTDRFFSALAALGGVGLLLIEDEANAETSVNEVRQKLVQNNFQECSDYLGVGNLLSEGAKLFYTESDEKLDAHIFKIIEEFYTGRVVFMNTENHIGFKVATFDPSKTSLILVATRAQVEESYDRLFEYTNFIQPI